MRSSAGGRGRGEARAGGEPARLRRRTPLPSPPPGNGAEFSRPRPRPHLETSVWPSRGAGRSGAGRGGSPLRERPTPIWEAEPLPREHLGLEVVHLKSKAGWIPARPLLGSVMVVLGSAAAIVTGSEAGAPGFAGFLGPTSLNVCVPVTACLQSPSARRGRASRSSLNLPGCKS